MQAHNLYRDPNTDWLPIHGAVIAVCDGLAADFNIYNLHNEEMDYDLQTVQIIESFNYAQADDWEPKLEKWFTELANTIPGSRAMAAVLNSRRNSRYVLSLEDLELAYESSTLASEKWASAFPNGKNVEVIIVHRYPFVCLEVAVLFKIDNG